MSVCDKIEDSGAYDKDDCYLCIVIQRKDVSFCNELSEKSKINCSYQMALQNADFSSCNGLSGAEQYQYYYPAMSLIPNYFEINRDIKKTCLFCETFDK